MTGDIFTTCAPAVSYAERGVPPPSPLYIGPDEGLIVDSWAMIAEGDIPLVARVLTPDGHIQTNRFVHRSLTPYTRETSRFPLAEGFLLSVQVDVIGLFFMQGACFVNIALQRGEGTAGVVVAQLIADYLTSSARLAWPGGRIVSALDGPGYVGGWVGADPAAGAEVSITVSYPVQWRVHGVYLVLTTSAVVADRRVDLVIDDSHPENIIALIEAPAVQAASLTRGYNYGVGYPSRAALGATHLAPLPWNCYVWESCRIRTVTANLQAGDDYAAPIVMYEGWFSV